MSRSHDIAILIAAAAPIAVAAIGKIDQPPLAIPAPIAIVANASAPPALPTTPPPPATPPAAFRNIVSDGDPAACVARFGDVPRPVQRGDDAAAGETIVCRRGYMLGFDAVTRDPDWVMERLTAADLTGPAKRGDKFRQDALVLGRDASLADYKASAAEFPPRGLDRGHQAPAGDARFDQRVMDQSFFLTNMAPQVGIGFNRGAWKYLEESVRGWVTCGGRPVLYVFTGPIYATQPKAPTMGSDRVAVPVAFYKIVYDPAADRAVGFELPNAPIGATIPNLQARVKSIAAIEGETGLDFFSSFEPRRQTQLEATPAVAWGHIATCPPSGGD